jgi:hypothetical protein
MSTNTDTDAERDQNPKSESKPDHSNTPQPTEPDIETTSIEPAATEQVPEEVRPLQTVSDAPPRLFRAAMRTDVLKRFLRALRTLVDEARIRFTADSLTVRAVDPANVVMDDLELGVEALKSPRRVDHRLRRP